MQQNHFSAAAFLLIALIANDSVSASEGQVDCSTLTGKVMCGYQGWFNCPGDGSGLGWRHWGRNGQKKLVGPGNVTVDLWPDLSELGQEERFSTDFQHADGRRAEVFSSANRKTVVRHFKWMRDYGIDGAFVQRFATSLRSSSSRRNRDLILDHCRNGAELHGRAFAVMYDLSSMREGSLDRVLQDWKRLQNDQGIAASPSYLHHKNKPLVAVWGVGFKDRHHSGQYSLDDCRELIAGLKEAGCSIMLGVPTGWRDLSRDCVDDNSVHDILKMADVISPWTPGRYRNPDEAARHGETCWKPDRMACKSLGQDYLPVVFPGFSWRNLKGSGEALGAIPRLNGRFLWSQIVAAKNSGADMLYVAMFDEVDEGTAVFKCTNDPPVGQGVEFLTYNGLPSDYYLRLVGRAGKVIGSPSHATTDLPDDLLLGVGQAIP